MPRPVITARWANLAIVSYAVPAAVLGPYMPVAPDGETLELDRPDDPTRLGLPARADVGYVSLVALEFLHCRLYGFPLPLHQRFVQVNFRFYVRTARSHRRGVVFIRQLVPSPFMARGGRWATSDDIVATRTHGTITQDTRHIRAEYRWVWPPPKGRRALSTARLDGGRGPGIGPGVQAPPGEGMGTPPVEYTLSVTGRKPPTRPGPATPEHFFKERQWGFAMRAPRAAGLGGVLGRAHAANGLTGPATPVGIVYEVVHPTWSVYPAEETSVNVDFAHLFGPDWGFLSGARPDHALLAAGSEVAVFPPRRSLGVRWGVRT